MLRIVGRAVGITLLAALCLLEKARRDLHRGHVEELRRQLVDEIKRKERVRARRCGAWRTWDGDDWKVW